MKKSIFKAIIICLALALVMTFAITSAPSAKSKTMAYYSGEAINYNGRLFVGTTNMKSFELFVLENKELERTAKIKHGLNFRPRTEEFFDLEFKIEQGRLYAYLADGRFLFKYDVSNPWQPSLADKILDNSRKWFAGLDQAGDNLASISNEGVNIWNQNMQIVNSHSVKSNDYREISLSPNGGFIFLSQEENVEIFSTSNRSYVSTLSIVSNEDHARKIFNDEERGEIYLCDDSSLKVFNFNGQLQRKFTHISDRGYDVDGVDGSDYVYFSDGLGIVKINKISMKPADWAYTTNLGSLGGWAMGLNVVAGVDGDMVVVFNNSSILVLDKNLDLIDHFAATEEDVDASTEDMWISLDKNRAAGGSEVSVRGGGFGPYEEVVVKLTNNKNFPPRAIYQTRANYQGRINAILLIPSDTKPGVGDIRMESLDGTKTWSTNFTIE